jgi:putative ABC transport system substrate-binding protein
VLSSGDDPIKDGIVASLNSPGGNVTGASFFTDTLEAKRVELLHTMVPKVSTIGILVNPNNPRTEATLKDVQSAADAIGNRLFITKAAIEADFDKAFVDLAKEQTGMLVVASDPFFNSDAISLWLSQRVTHSPPSINFGTSLLAAVS